MSYTLKDIAKTLYHQKYAESAHDDDLDDFYMAIQKNFKDLLKTLTIEEDFKLLKKGREYTFVTEDTFNFWIWLLSSYTNEPIKTLRLGDFEKIDDQTMIKIHEGILGTFRDADSSDLDLYLIEKKLHSISNYFVRKLRATIEKSKKDLVTYFNDYLSQEQLSDQKPIYGSILLFPDIHEWLVKFNQELTQLSVKWSAILPIMNTLRLDEASNLFDLILERNSSNYMCEYTVEKNALYQLKKDPAYCKLIQECERLEQELSSIQKNPPLSLRDRKKWRSETNKKMKEYMDISNKLSTMEEDAEKKVKNQIPCPSVGADTLDNIQIFMSPGQLLNQAEQAWLLTQVNK